MTDQQILTLAVAACVPFLAVCLGVLLNNSRLNDLKDLVNHRLNDVKELLLAEIRAESAETRSVIEKHHSELMMKFVETDNRLSKLEAPRLQQ